jgi:hypothetical protein
LCHCEEGVFFARCRSASSFKRSIPEIAPFSRKTYQSCHCEEGAAFAPDAAILNGAIRHPETNYGCAERNRTLKERERKWNDAANPFFVIGIPFVSCSRASVRDAMPQTLRLPRRCAPRNDTKSGRFCLENRRFLFYAVVFCAVSLRIVFQTFRSGNCFVFPQNLSLLSLRGGRSFCARRGNLKRIDFYTVSAAFGSLFCSSPLPLVCLFKKMMFLEKNA